MESNNYDLSIQQYFQDLQSPLLPKSIKQQSHLLQESSNNFEFNDEHLIISDSRSIQNQKIQFLEDKSLQNDFYLSQHSSKILSENEFIQKMKDHIEVNEVYSTKIISNISQKPTQEMFRILQRIYLKNIKNSFQQLCKNQNPRNFCSISQKDKIKEQVSTNITKKSNSTNEMLPQVTSEKAILIDQFTERINNVIGDKIKDCFCMIYCHNINEYLKNQPLLIPENSLQFILSRINTENQNQTKNFTQLQIEKNSFHMPRNFLYDTGVQFNPSQQQIKEKLKPMLKKKYSNILTTQSLRLIMRANQIEKVTPIRQSKFIKHEEQNKKVLHFNKRKRRRGKLTSYMGSPPNYKTQKKMNCRIFQSEQKSRKQLSERSNDFKNKDLIPTKKIIFQQKQTKKPLLLPCNSKAVTLKLFVQQPLQKSMFYENSPIPSSTYYLRPDTFKEQINDISDNLIIKCIDSDPDEMFDIFVEQPYSLSNYTNMMKSFQDVKQSKKIDKYQINLCPSCYRSSMYNSRKSMQSHKQYSQKLKKNYQLCNSPKAFNHEINKYKIINSSEYQTIFSRSLDNN